MEKYLIINGDDFGMCHSANLAINDLVIHNKLQSTTIMTVAPWAKEAVSMVKVSSGDYHVGVHITHTSEWDNYRWSGFANLNTLKDFDNMLPRTSELAMKAPIEDRIIEATAQIEWLRKQRVSITHIDNHMRTCIDHPVELLKLADKYGMGMRWPCKMLTDKDADNWLLHHEISVPDFLNDGSDVYVSDRQTYESHCNAYIQMLDHMKYGINEWFMHPAIESDELKAIAPDWKVRVFDYNFLNSIEFQNTVLKNQIKLVGYEDISSIRLKERKI